MHWGVECGVVATSDWRPLSLCAQEQAGRCAARRPVSASRPHVPEWSRSSLHWSCCACAALMLCCCSPYFCCIRSSACRYAVAHPINSLPGHIKLRYCIRVARLDLPSIIRIVKLSLCFSKILQVLKLDERFLRPELRHRSDHIMLSS